MSRSTMRCLFVVVFASQMTPMIEGVQQCDRTWQNVGCFANYGNRRLLPELLITDRDITSAFHGGHRIDWMSYETYLHSLVCRCAKKAQEKGHDLFGIEFYGECWGGQTRDLTRVRRASNCVNGKYQASKCIGRRRTGETKEDCAAGASAIYIYELDPKLCKVAVNLGVILHLSDNFPGKISILSDFLQELAIGFQLSSNGSRLGLIVYNNDAKLILPFNDLSRQNPVAMETILANQTTAAGAREDLALELAHDQLLTAANGHDPVRPDVLILVTDGTFSGPLQARLELLSTVVSLKLKEVEMLAVGVGPRVDDMELVVLSMMNPAHVVKIDRYEALATSKLDSIVDLLCPK